MTESEWLACDDAQPMLDYLEGKASQRKLRLFASACCRQVWRWVTDEHSQAAVEVAEQFADGAAAARQLKTAERKAAVVASYLASHASVATRMSEWAIRDAAAAVSHLARKRFSPEGVARLTRSAIAATPDKPNDQAGLLRDLFANPFRPIVFDPAWRTETAVALARQMYESPDFSAMPILADALQDAGCECDEVLTHCRDPKGSHVRGCWVLDLALGKS
jgi:hypothetical protein